MLDPHMEATPAFVLAESVEVSVCVTGVVDKAEVVIPSTVPAAIVFPLASVQGSIIVTVCVWVSLLTGLLFSVDTITRL